MSTIFIGDVGTEIILDCGVNVLTASVINIKVKKPSGAKVSWLPIFKGTNGLAYTTVVGDIDIAGTWELQVYLEMPGWKGYGDVATMQVKKPI